MTARVLVRSYLSPTLVLLAFDWPDGAERPDFLGFAIRRTPGFRGAATSWLPNRITFDGPPPDGRDSASNQSPIQKFMWWDARFGDIDRGRVFKYELFPAVGKPKELELVENARAILQVKIPKPVVGSIGTYFNRAVVSSQAFVSEFGRRPTGAKLERALA